MSSQPRRPFLASASANVRVDSHRDFTANSCLDSSEAATGNQACDHKTIVSMAGSRSGAQTTNEREVR